MTVRLYDGRGYEPGDFAITVSGQKIRILKIEYRRPWDGSGEQGCTIYSKDGRTFDHKQIRRYERASERPVLERKCW